MSRYYRRKKRRKAPAVIALLLFLAGAAYVTGFLEPFLSKQIFPEYTGEFDPGVIPPYDGNPAFEVNGGVPFFEREELEAEPFESYGDLDLLGRCTAAFACAGPETMPEEERGEIREIYPTGWHNARYEGIDRDYLYNRCHLIAYQLTGENANSKNLFTGTRYLNTEGMLPYENLTASYIRRTGHHVLYRVTPVFEGANLVASGVLMEARSVEDPEIQFCVYCYNVQPGIEISYDTGKSRKIGE